MRMDVRMNLSVSMRVVKKYITDTAGTLLGNTINVTRFIIHFVMSKHIKHFTQPILLNFGVTNTAMILMGMVMALRMVLMVFFEKL